ncbi:MAG TPA: NAD+ synthase [Thiothrix sp.]|nr:NAD+ synthase [Thiothrix sp.]
MNRTLKVALAQLNVTVGDLKGNTQQIVAAIEQARDQQQADVIVFPELVISGYPPEDLLFRPAFLQRVEQYLAQLAAKCQGITAIVGAPIQRDKCLYNEAIMLQDGKILRHYAKQTLPNYRVFDEKRYFKAGHDSTIISINGVKLALLICEDIWHDEPAQQAKAAGADCLCVLNASPFRVGKREERHQLLSEQSQQHQCAIIYVNLVGGQDELVFDGESCLYNAEGHCVYQAPVFTAGTFVSTLDFQQAVPIPIPSSAMLFRSYPEDQLIYQALVLGVRDYVNKNGFSGVLFGLSGGIDSALVAAIAVDALGAEAVEAVMMPFRYTSSMSIEDARQEADTLGINYREMPIEPIYNSFMSSLADEFSGTTPDATEENLQARTRGVLLMAMSNKLGKMLLATSNKSEMSVGYATLYGDMSGGFAPLKDVSKLRVYALARYRNRVAKASGQPEIIPQRVIDRPPSAELAPDQTDQDSLPPYEVLDPILQAFIEEYQCIDAIVAQGYDEATVRRVVNLVLVNEYKRRQAAPGVRISQRAFGKDRRYPITSAYRRQMT